MYKSGFSRKKECIYIYGLDITPCISQGSPERKSVYICMDWSIGRSGAWGKVQISFGHCK